jgi:hypothetical protein
MDFTFVFKITKKMVFSLLSEMSVKISALTQTNLYQASIFFSQNLICLFGKING